MIPDTPSTRKRVTDPLPCSHCGTLERPLIGPGAGPHPFRATCRHCGQFLQWVSAIPSADFAARRDLARRAAMAQRPPSQAQLDYLKVLGDQAEPPTNMAEASQRIERLLHKGEVQP